MQTAVKEYIFLSFHRVTYYFFEKMRTRISREIADVTLMSTQFRRVYQSYRTASYIWSRRNSSTSENEINEKSAHDEDIVMMQW